MLDYKDLKIYQHCIIEQLVSVERCAVFAYMGAGKTVSTLTALDILYSSGEDWPVLVLAPRRVAVSTWPGEVRKWAHLKGTTVMPVVGSLKERKLALSFPSRIYTTNYENLPWLVEYMGDAWPFRTVVADEAPKLKSYRGSVQTRVDGTTFIREGGGMRARALGTIAHCRIKRMIELTGTPAPNGLQDLWGQIWFLDAGKRLGRTFTSFRERWFSVYDGHTLTPTSVAQQEIQERLSDICLTIDIRDYIDIQDPIVTDIVVDLPPKARNIYNDMADAMFAELACGATIEAFTAAAKTQKLLQMSSGALYLDPVVDSDASPKSKEWREVHRVKVDALEEIVEEACGAPILVAYHFRSDAQRLLKAFPQARLLDNSPSTIDEWNAGRIPILLAHPASAGHGLNLQHGGNIIVYFSHDWNLENRDQILERIGPLRQHQAGYDRPVYVYNIIARDTMDEIVIERTTTKRSVQDLLLEALKRRVDTGRFEAVS